VRGVEVRRARRTLDRKEAEFLPAALEIQESPPSPWGRLVGLTIMLLFAAGIGWAVVGRVDTVAVGRGRLIPSDHSKVIQPVETGIVRAIHVRDGQGVRRGQVLIELDPTTSVADLERLRSERAGAQVQVARLRAVLSEGDLEPVQGADPRLVAIQARMLRDQRAEQAARLLAVRMLIKQREAAIAGTTSEIERLEALVPMYTERAEAFGKLLKGEFVSRLQYLEIEAQRITTVQQLAVQRERLNQDRAALDEASRQHDVVEAEFKRSRLAELSDWEMRATSLGQEVQKAQQRAAVQRLTAPIDGTVQQLVVHTLGGVVTPAQALLTIVPTESSLEVEASLENKDIGFVRVGQPAEIKVDTFPFTRYGTIAGSVATVSQEATQVENVGLVYSARVSLNRTVIDTEERRVPLMPGMAVSVEIQTGKRRLIEFFLSPLLRYSLESLRER
jgi:hemolysin D